MTESSALPDDLILAFMHYLDVETLFTCEKFESQASSQRVKCANAARFRFFRCRQRLVCKRFYKSFIFKKLKHLELMYDPIMYVPGTKLILLVVALGG